MIKTLVNRWGVAVTTVVLTLGSIVVSFIVLFVLTAILQTNIRLEGMAGAIIVPILLIPFLANATLPALVELDSAKQALQELLTIDRLTMAFNQKYLVDALENQLARGRRYGEKFSLLLFDLDNFSAINETFGRHVGDNVLRTVTEICRMEMRRPDILARYGNDEFACVLPYTFGGDAMEFAERLRSNVARRTLTSGDEQIHFTISIGVKTLDNETAVDEIIRATVKALSDAKAQGKNRCVLADNELVLEKV